MKLKKQEYHLENKGYVFSLDAVIALIVVIAVITFTSFYLNRAEESSLANLQLLKIGNDIFKLMDEENILQEITLNHSSDYDAVAIMGALGFDNETGAVPINFEMKITSKCYKITGTSFSIGNPDLYFETNVNLSNDRFIGSGTRYFFISHKERQDFIGPDYLQDPKENYHCIGRYQIWQS